LIEFHTVMGTIIEIKNNKVWHHLLWIESDSQSVVLAFNNDKD